MLRKLREAGIVCAVTLGAALSAGGGCLNRPVIASNPTTKVNFTTPYQANAIDKVDILIDIDNSASMGDKHDYLKKAIPDLITRLVTPNCVDPATGQSHGSSDANGSCAQGKVEFPPVHDMHIGIVTSSLGTRLSETGGTPGTLCAPSDTIVANGSTLSTHNDDKGELVARSGDTEAALADAPSQFLAWFPESPANVGKTPPAARITATTQLENDFSDLVAGVHEYGCGIESQLESWYRFLVQPDPYASLALDANGHAQWVGVDATILQERRDFLRTDSLLAVIVLSDENDSEIDVRSYGGQGYHFMQGNYQPSRGTQSCATNPNDPLCTTCLAVPDPQSDPSCAQGPYASKTDWGLDPNLRHVHMKQKYGVVPQFPIQRYVLGLTSSRVPDRNGEYPPGASDYQGLTNAKCTNPLFAAVLPDGSKTDAATLCSLPLGTRTGDLLYYAHIGGVPHQLLQVDASNPDSPQKDTLSSDDWVKILGKDPQHYDYTGIDPHMIESYQPRMATSIGVPSAPDDFDPISGRDWVTDQGYHTNLNVDRQYACTFRLAQARDCSDPNDAATQDACDCSSRGLTHEQTPPICAMSTVTNDYNLQVKAKAYPTVRELLLAKLLDTHGIVSSLCPIHTGDRAGGTDPLYGYRPAMNAIVNRLKDALNSQCLPEKLAPDPSGFVPCLVLVTLTSGSFERACDPGLGLSVPAPDVLDRFQQNQHAAWLAAGGSMSGKVDPSTLPTCQLDQLTGSALSNATCADSRQKGWCYVTGAQAGKCSQGILFSQGALPKGAEVSLTCIEATPSGN